MNKEDYYDHTKWVEVEDNANMFYLDASVEFDLEKISMIFSDLIEKAEEIGLEGCFLRFSSHMEPYEDWLGNPSVVACGYRKLNEEEKAAIEKENFLYDMASRMEITIPEARVLHDLNKRGKIKI